MSSLWCILPSKDVLGLCHELKTVRCSTGGRWGVVIKQVQKCFIYLEATFLGGSVIWNIAKNKIKVKTATKLPKCDQKSEYPGSGL